MNLNNILLLTSALIIHEIGHLIAMKKFKFKDVNILLFPFIGGVTVGYKNEIKQSEKAVIIISGPLLGILIGIILFILDLYIQNPIFKDAANIFLIINLFNLLPFYPLDGGLLLDTLTENNKTKTFKIVLYIISTIGLSIAAIIFNPFILIYISVFIALGFIMQIENKNAIDAVKNSGFNFNKKYSEISSEEYWEIRDFLMHLRIQNGMYSLPNKFEVLKDEHLKIKQIKSLYLNEEKTIFDFTPSDKINMIIVWLFCIFICLQLTIWI